MLEGIGSGEVLLTSAFIAYETAFAYSQFLPSIMTIGSFVDSAEKVDMIRQGELTASLFAVGFAVLFSFILHSALPLLLAGLAIVFTLFVYERALQNAPYYTGKPIEGTQSMESTEDEYSGDGEGY